MLVPELGDRRVVAIDAKLERTGQRLASLTAESDELDSKGSEVGSTAQLEVDAPANRSFSLQKREPFLFQY